MDLVVHIVVAEIEVVQGYETRADFVSAPPHFRSKETNLIPLRSVRRDVGERIDEEDGFSVHLGVGLEDVGEFVRLGFRGRFELAEIVPRHVLSDHDDDNFRVWENSRIVIDMIGDMANLGARNGVETRGRSVGGVPKNR